MFWRGRAAYGSVRNFNTASVLSKKEVEQFLPTKKSYKNFGPAIKRFQRFQAFSKNVKETWCMVIIFVDKLASQNKRVKYLLIAIDIFSRFVRDQTMKTKFAKDTLRAFKK